MNEQECQKQSGDLEKLRDWRWQIHPGKRVSLLTPWRPALHSKKWLHFPTGFPRVGNPSDVCKAPLSLSLLSLRWAQPFSSCPLLFVSPAVRPTSLRVPLPRRARLLGGLALRQPSQPQFSLQSRRRSLHRYKPIMLFGGRGVSAAVLLSLPPYRGSAVTS